MTSVIMMNLIIQKMRGHPASVCIIITLFVLFASGCGSQKNLTFEDRSSTPSSVFSVSYVPGELLVKFQEGTSAVSAQGLHSSINAVRIKEFKPLRVHRVKFPVTMSVEEAKQFYNRQVSVEYAEPNYIVRAAEIPDDSFFDLLWGLHNTGQTGGTPDADIDAPEAWDSITGSEDVIIAVLDSGLARNHPDVSSNVWTNPEEEVCPDGRDNDGNGYVDDCYGWDFIDNDSDPMDTNGHGTLVSGIIGAQGDNATGTAGVLWNVRIMPLRMLGVSGGGTIADAISAILYADAHNARVINASWGGNGYSQALKDAIDASEALVVCAAGNSGTDNDEEPFYPASYTSANIISVTASDHNDGLSSFSNVGSDSVDLAAPGVDIYGTYPILVEGSPLTVFSEDFDMASGNLPILGWDRGGTHSTWAVTDGTGTGDTNSLEDSPSADYLDNTDSWARYMNPIALSGDSRYTLSFRWKAALAQIHDFLHVDYSPDGMNWDRLDSLAGSTGGAYALYAEDVTDLADSIDMFYPGFSLTSDNASHLDGVYIDDMELIETGVEISGYGYDKGKGSSFAAPHVSGTAGLVLAMNPVLSSRQVRDVILNTTDPISSMSGSTITGGRLNAARAVRFAVTPDAPSGLTVAALPGTDIHLEWKDNAQNETGFTIERKRGAGPFSLIADVGPDITGYTDLGLAASVFYQYRVRAFNDAGDSDYSNEAGATTGQSSSNNGGGGSGGGCALVPGRDEGPVDMVMPLLLIALLLGSLRWGSRRKSGSEIQQQG